MYGALGRENEVLSYEGWQIHGTPVPMPSPPPPMLLEDIANQSLHNSVASEFCWMDVELWAAPPGEGLTLCTSGGSGATCLTSQLCHINPSDQEEQRHHAALFCIS